MMTQMKLWILAAILIISGTTSFASCSDNKDNPYEQSEQAWRELHQPTVTRIQECGTLQVGTTGDYRPLSFREDDGTYWGFGIEMAGEIAKRLKIGSDIFGDSLLFSYLCPKVCQDALWLGRR
jgi:cyclohexadienyl dehydratase